MKYIFSVLVALSFACNLAMIINGCSQQQDGDEEGEYYSEEEDEDVPEDVEDAAGPEAKVRPVGLFSRG